MIKIKYKNLNFYQNLIIRQPHQAKKYLEKNIFHLFSTMKTIFILFHFRKFNIVICSIITMKFTHCQYISMGFFKTDKYYFLIKNLCQYGG